MLKFFFYRSSKFAPICEAVGVILAIFLARRLVTETAGRLLWLLYFIFIASYAFMRFCAVFRFYPKLPRSSGIELHFSKMVLAAGYTLAAICGAALAMPPLPWLLFGVALMVGIVHINVILIYLHLKDQDKTHPNKFSLHCDKRPSF